MEDAAVTASAGNPGVALAGGASACAAGPAVAVAEVGGVAGGLAGALAVEAPGWVLADASGCAVLGLTFAAAGSAAACDMALAVAASVVTGFGAAPDGALSERAWDAGLAPGLGVSWFGVALGAAVLAPGFDALWLGVALGAAVPAPGVAAVAGGGAGLAMGAAGL